MNSPPALIQLNDFPWDNSSSPAVAEYNDALRRYLPGTESTPTLTQGWAAAEIFGKAATMMGDVVSKDKLLDALWSFKNETFGGLTPPLTFVQGHPAPNANCWFYVTVKNGKMTAPQGNTPLCR
jgi:branched-chain amino acid transport system substrate-binding protein